jgi:hypothetical protein
MPTAPRMYILVRKDLENIYSCVQGAHALAQYAVEHPEEFKLWNNGYLIFLGVRFPREIREWEERLATAGKKFSVFSEPDQDGVKTAIACYDTGDIFCGLRLA